MLNHQRLRLCQGEAGDITFGDATEIAERLPLSRKRTVCMEGEIRGERIRHKRPALTADDREPFLEWAQPVDHMTDDGAVIQFADNDHHVLVLPAAAPGRPSGDG